MLFFGKKKEQKEPVEKAEPPKESKPILPETVKPTIPETVKIEKSLTTEDVNKAKSELRVASIEREAWGETLARIYEASAEGKITVEERDNLVEKYKDQLSKFDVVLDRNQKVISLYELEETRAELLKMFNDKFKDLSSKIDEVRNRLGFTPKIVSEIKFTPTSVEKPKPHPPAEKSTATPPATATTTPRKTKADEELDKLREDLQKELEKLEQIEMEG